jgi:hypothetical protein
MRFHFHPEAAAEFDKAVEYYEQRQSGLGLEFAAEVYAAIARIIEYPAAWSPMSKNTRRCLINRFPYGVIYDDFVKSRHSRPRLRGDKLWRESRIHVTYCKYWIPVPRLREDKLHRPYDKKVKGKSQP